MGTTILGNPHMGKSTDFKFYLYTNLVGLLLHLSRLPSRKKSEFARNNSFLMLAYYTIERHTPKNLTMVNGWWTDKAILCCQQEVEIDFQLHFDPRLWKPLGWKMLRHFRRCWTLGFNLTLFECFFSPEILEINKVYVMLWNQELSLQSEILAEMISEKLPLNVFCHLFCAWRSPPCHPAPSHDHWQTRRMITGVDWPRV